MTTGLYTVELNKGLSEQEVEWAEKIIDWLTIKGHFFGINGHMIVTGMPRQGKGLFASFFIWLLIHLFKGKHVLSDEALKPAFGPHDIFNEDVLREDIDKMAQMNKDLGIKQQKDFAKLKESEKQSLIDGWITDGPGKTLLQNSILRLAEYWRYMFNRRPGSMMNYFMMGILKQWGHMDSFIIGDSHFAHDLDAYTCLPYVNYDVRCTWSNSHPNTVEAKLYRVEFNRAKQCLVPVDRKPIPIYICGSLQMPMLGIKEIDKDGNPVYNTPFDLYFSKSPPQFKFGTKPVSLGGTI